ncbi:MAG TPA: hypothetical protein VMV33_09330 [Rhodocyclaceae bacterium]|nr:hypothetical protein [Rhodocyclaceae bacterium]
MTDESDVPERRRNLELRGMFADAYALVEPFFDPANRWNGQTLEHLAFRVMREHYPNSSSDDIYVFLAAAKRCYAERVAGPGR